MEYASVNNLRLGALWNSPLKASGPEAHHLGAIMHKV
jgi:hypothetical protein